MWKRCGHNTTYLHFSLTFNFITSLISIGIYDLLQSNAICNLWYKLLKIIYGAGYSNSHKTMCQCKNICGIISYNNQGARFDDCSIRQMDCQNCKKERIFLICRLNKGFYFMLQNIQSTKRFGWISLKGSNSNFSFLEAYDFTQGFFEIVHSTKWY